MWSATSISLHFMPKSKPKQKLMRDSTVYKNTWQPREHKHHIWKLFCRICVFVWKAEADYCPSEVQRGAAPSETHGHVKPASASHFLLLCSAVFKLSAPLSSLINRLIIPKPAAVDISNNTQRAEQNSAFRAAESQSGVCWDRPSYESSSLPQTSPDGSAAGMRTMTGIPGFSQIWPVGTSAPILAILRPGHTLGMNYLTRFVFMSGCDPNHTACNSKTGFHYWCKMKQVTWLTLQLLS